MNEATEELTVAPAVELRMMTCWTKVRIKADSPEEAVMLLVDNRQPVEGAPRRAGSVRGVGPEYFMSHRPAYPWMYLHFGWEPPGEPGETTATESDVDWNWCFGL